MGQWRRVRSRLEHLVRELAKFGTVGAFGFLVNVAVFNLCIHTFDLAAVRSGVIATGVAIATNYVGNRYWTYRHVDKSRVQREVSLFLLFSGIGMVIENGVLAISHYGLDFTSPLADNIAKNVVGLGIGTIFRFWSYRTWVFRDRDGAGESATEEEPAGDRGEERDRQPADRPTGAVRDVEAAVGDGETAGRDGATAADGSVTRRRRAGLPAQEEGEDRRVLLK
ncbi:GtrA family protein [Streptomyces oceani]|uniref:GtrA/DPMS transmembrane domain-containing protein n=1 Tax=Streptomyces oceani TaxID=1075402 RepID=A0A1E7KNI1_9ACTN|nr:hypothetical protein AN216_02985 [Streptomyces oceani]